MTCPRSADSAPPMRSRRGASSRLVIILLACSPFLACLLFAIALAVAGVIGELTMSPEARAERDARNKAAAEKAQASAADVEAEIAMHRRNAAVRLEEANESLTAKLSEDSAALLLLDDFALEFDGQAATCTYTVSSHWHERSKQTRLQDAQILHAKVKSCFTPGTTVRTTYIDLNGNRVGGTGVMGGMSVAD